MRRHRGGAPTNEERESSSDEDDAFALLSRTSKKSKTKEEPQAAPLVVVENPMQLPASTTSSNKRHHIPKEHRQAKMDALLEELVSTASASNNTKTSLALDNHQSVQRGSFVRQGEENITTNLFVGNLAPSVTEEEMTELFSQFGELYSIKIMWPRNQESASRNRHTGFVCFRHRCDAEDCLAACDERDVFNKGRNIFLRWGKHVAMDMPPQQQQQSGCLTSGPIKNPQYALSPSVQFDPVHHERLTICIVTPVDARRVNLITLVASFVAKDGRQLEVELQNRRANDNDFQFLFYGKGDPIDHLYYKWRVYAFANGDGQYLWRTEPFQMLQDGCFWIPPPLEKEAAQRELVYLEEQRRQQERQQQERRLQTARRDYVTGRQLENKRNRSTKLSPRELEELTVLFQRNLCAARVPICEAMAFAFEKSVAATQICDILKDLLTTQSDPDVEVMIARIYLLSDVLFNSQQPGVKNAFKFRDAIEKMAPNIFKALRSPYGESLGRMTQNKLARVVRNVLAAWGEWNVFNTQFLEELTAYFEGREPASEVSILTSTFDVNLLAENTLDDQPAANDKQISIRKTGAAFEPVVDHESDRLHEEDGEPLDDDDDVNGEPIDDDGEPMSDDEDLDGEPMYDDADGEPIDDDTDGQPDGDDYKPIVDDGDRMSDGGDTDGEPLDGEVDGEPIDDDADCRPRDYDHAAADSQHVEDGEVPDDGRLL